MNRENGFTLLELIIVMAIISLLAGFGVSQFPGLQKSSRDTQRKSDLKQYQTALESYANRKGGFYPSRTAAWTFASDINGVNPNLCTDISMSQCPADPKIGQSACGSSGTCNYYYVGNGTNNGLANATRFVLYSRLERQVNGNDVFFVVCSGGKTGTVNVSSWATPSSTCPL